MSGIIVSCLQAASTAWVDLAAAARAHWRLACLGTAVCSVSSMAYTVSNPDEALTTFLLLAFAVAIAEALLLTPVLVAAHRHIILDERGPAGPINWLSFRNWRFFSFSAGLIVLLFLPLLIAQRWAVSDDEALVGIALLIVAAIIAGMWLSLIFPAIAVDAPGVSVRNALADIKGNVWRIFWAAAVASAPILATYYVLGLAQEALTQAAHVEPQLIRFASAPVEGLLAASLYVLLVVIASRFYMALGQRLNQPS